MTKAMLDSPASYTAKLKQLTCPTRICVAADTLAPNSNPTIEIDKDVSDFPYTEDLSASLDNP